jgi:tungstate transport system substrate-binding protein
MLIRSLLFVAAIVTSLATQAAAEDKSIVVASTTSTQDSGLFDYLLPIFKQKTGIDVKVLAQGTDVALRCRQRCVAGQLLDVAQAAAEPPPKGGGKLAQMPFTVTAGRGQNRVRQPAPRQSS